jgi:uncharacterized protein
MSKHPAIVLAALLLAVAGPVLADNDPTPHQIYQAVEAGRLGEAQQMINQVLRDRPNSAQAHFVAAELDARVGDLTTAREQFAQAKQLDPTLHFASAHAVDELTAQLAGGAGPGTAGRGYTVQGFAPERHASFPWGFVLAVGLGLMVLWAILRARAATYTQPQVLPGAPPAQPYASGPGYGPGYPPAYPSAGSGLMGSLASGLAIGAGVAAGEELVHHVLDGNSSQAQGYVPPASDLRDAPVNGDMGGSDFGVNDPGSWDAGSSGGGGDFFGGGDGGGGGGGDWT